MDSQHPRPSATPRPDDDNDARANGGRRWRLPAHRIRICRVDSCQADDGGELAQVLEQRLGIKLDERTPDGAISLESLECIGLCDIRPSVTIDDEPVSVDQIKPRVEQAMLDNPNLIIVVETHRDAQYGLMVDVLDELKLAEATRISLKALED